VQLAVLPLMVQSVLVVVVCPFTEWCRMNVRTTSIATLRVALFIVIEVPSPPMILFVIARLVELLLCQHRPSYYYFRTIAR